jgi:tungstate transport system permease protein
MSDLGQALVIALRLIGTLDPELVGIVTLSLRVSLTATAIAFLIGAPAGATYRSRSASVSS